MTRREKFARPERAVLAVGRRRRVDSPRPRRRHSTESEACRILRRQYGRYTIPDFLGSRYEGNAARLIGVFAALLASFTYLIAQVTGVGLVVSRFIGLDFKIGVFVGLLGVLFCSVLGIRTPRSGGFSTSVRRPAPLRIQAR